MRGSVKRITRGIPKALATTPKATLVIVDTLAGELFNKSKENIRGLNLIDTGAMRNSAFLETTSGKSERAAAMIDATAASTKPGKKSGQPSFPLKFAKPGRGLKDNEARVAYAVEYAIYWEFGFAARNGASYMAPFLGPAAEDLKRTAPGSARKILDKYLKDVLKK